MYITEQKSGKFAEAAKEIFKARKAGDLELCAKIYTEVLGKAPHPNVIDNLDWWTFNAGRVVRSGYDSNLTAKQEKELKKIYLIRNETSEAWSKCKFAEKVHGGEWDYYYEY